MADKIDIFQDLLNAQAAGEFIKSVRYIRVSGVDQVKETGFDRQTENIKAWERGHPALISMQTFQEQISGTTEYGLRPIFMEMLAYCELNNVRIILVESSDRIARDLMVCELLLEQLRKVGISCIPVDLGFDLVYNDDPMRVYLRQQFASLAQLFKSMTVQRLARGKAIKKAKYGKCGGRNPFGKSKLDPPHAHQAIERIRQLASVGHSLRAIAKKLDKEGLTYRHGKPWAAKTVFTIMRQQGIKKDVMGSWHGANKSGAS